MKERTLHFSSIFLLLFLTISLRGQDFSVVPERGLRVMQLMKDPNGVRRYPDALPSLLKMMNEQTWAKFDTDPLFISELTDDRLYENPILYLNCDDQTNLEFTSEENQALRRYMELGGFVYLDAGIKASFLGADLGHSYAAWEERPEVKEWFAQVFPEKAFVPLPRNHDLFRTYFKGLPKNEDLRIEASQKRLPETVLTFVEQEKWPQGTYSFVGIKVKGRLACVASPICAMGWGRAIRRVRRIPWFPCSRPRPFPARRMAGS